MGLMYSPGNDDKMLPFDDIRLCTISMLLVIQNKLKLRLSIYYILHKPIIYLPYFFAVDNMSCVADLEVCDGAATPDKVNIEKIQ